MKKKTVIHQIGEKQRHNKVSGDYSGIQNLLTKIAHVAPVSIYTFRLGTDGKMSMPFSTPAITEIYGLPPEDLTDDFSRAWKLIHPDDQEPIAAAIKESARTMKPFECEWRVLHPTKGVIWLKCHSTPESEPDGGIIWYGYLHDITELKRAENERLINLRFFESMDQVNRAIQSANDLEQMMSNVLDALITILGCDRAWLVYPCDPNASSWSVPMECTRPEYPGGHALGVDFPMFPDVAESMRLCLGSPDPIVIGPGSENSVLPDIAIEYQVQSFMAMAIYPKTGKAWVFGLHQCSYPRIWTMEEKRLFSEIGRRLSDGLTTLLVSRNLQESEERFRQAFEFAGIGMALLSIDGRWLRANHYICEMLGYSEEELCQTTYQALTHPDDLIRGKKDALRVISGEIPYMQIEKRYRHRDGHYLWARLTTSVVRSSKNEPLYFVSQIENIDQRKKAEQHLSLLSFSLNRVKEGVYLIDENSRFQYINDEACRALGYTREELLGLSVPDIDPDYQMSRWREHWREIKEQGSVILETIHKTKDGQIIPVEINANYFEYDGHSYNLALVRDITERKLTEEALRRSEAELQIALDAAELGDWKWYLSKDELVWSSRCKAIYGLPPETEMSPDLFRSLVHPDDRPEVERVMNETLETGKDYETEKRIILPDGTERWTIGKGKTIYNENGVPVLMAGFTLDITERKLADEALRRSKADLELALEAGRLGDWKWNIVTGEITWSARCKVLYGLSPDTDISYERLLSLIHPDDREKVDTALKVAVETGADYELEKRIIWPDGSMHWTAGRARVFHDSKGQPVLMAGVTMDITKRKAAEEARHKAEAALHESDERFRQMAENIQEIFWLTDAQKKQMLYVSPAYETIWGRSCDSLYAEPLQWIESVHPEDRKQVNDAVTHQAMGDYDIEYRIIRPDGTTRHIHDRAFPIRNSSGEVYRIVGIAQDITSRKEQEAHIQYLAYHDALTGLPNRALVMNRLDQALAQAQRHKQMLAVLFIDLDRFKTINDTLGHPAGDMLLQQAGVCLTELLRDEDTVGRVGGDEFLILLPGLDTVQDVAHVTGKIHESLSVPFKVTGHQLHITASIGISLYPRDADKAETLVKYADTALYLAKEQGRDTFRFFSPELDAKVRARLHLENDLRCAIDRDELLLHYQPQMNLSTGQLTGAEALLRWQHPAHGLVSPAEFIAIAEETGLIIPIGAWVLRRACTQARAWQLAGIAGFRISVNLSSRQLEQADIAESIYQILQDTGCDPRLLELEITESTVMNQPVEAIVKLQALHEMGIQLAMDDFGTGYSSLAYLKRFPLDRLKIDKSFVDGIPEDNDDMVIVQTIIVLARQLRLKVTAEGVETEAQQLFLKANGCDEMQGYLLSKPLLAEELEKLSGFPLSCNTKLQ